MILWGNFYFKMQENLGNLLKESDPIVYLGLGTNLGDRLANLKNAAGALPPRVIVLRSSSIYETEPWGFRQQPDFLNQVLEVNTSLDPARLLAYLKRIERKLGRQPSFHYGPRLIDIDILFYGDQVIEQPDLVIPHPRLAERAFMLVPMAELAPALRHPIRGLTVQEMLAQVETTGVTKI